MKKAGIILVCILFAPFFAGAQTSYSESDISLSVTPTAPAPNQQVTITLTSYSVNLDKARMVWTENGQTKSTGTGIKSFMITTGDIGFSTTVSVSIIVDTSNRFDKKVVITPSAIDMLWEATDSYVPPFYEGKALPSSEATIKVTALPQAGSKDYVYSWKRNFTPDQASSGFSKNTFTFRTSYLNNQEDISVSVSPVSGSGGGEGKLTIVTGKPKILLYEESPLEGVLTQQALNNGYRLTNSEANIIALPFFFSALSPTAGDLNYKWSINNNAIDTPNPKNELVVRGGGAEGRAKIGLKIESVSKLFQLLEQTFFVDIIK